MSFFTLSDGTNAAATPVTGEYEVPGGNLEPIPDGSTVLAIIDEAKWAFDEASTRYFLSLRWSVLQPDDFKNRKIFQKLWIEETDPREKDEKKAKAKKDRALKMFLAIDFNAGGNLAKSGERPTDETLMAHLTNKPMVIMVGVWAMKGAEGDDMSGNWVRAVGASTKAVQITNAKMPVAKAASAPASAGTTFAADLNDDLPF